MDIRIDTDNKIKSDPAKSAWNNSTEAYDKSATEELSFSGLNSSKRRQTAQSRRLMETPIVKKPVRKEAERPKASSAPRQEAERRREQPDLATERASKPRREPEREKTRAPEPTVMSREEAEEYATLRKKHERRKRRIGILAAAVFLVGILGFLTYRILRIAEITVKGNEALSAEYIVELSGLTEGEHIFTIDLDALKKSFSRDARVAYQEMHYRFPNRIELVIEECLPVGKFQLSDGSYVLIDAAGKAVGEKQTVREYILVEGLELTDYSIGYAVRTADTYKQSILTELLTALEEADYNGEIERIDIGSITNIKLYHHSGMEIRFGNSENFSLKIDWTRAVMESLSERGITEGIVDVYSEDHAIYSKPDTVTSSDEVQLNYLNTQQDTQTTKEDEQSEEQ